MRLRRASGSIGRKFKPSSVKAPGFLAGYRQSVLVGREARVDKRPIVGAWVGRQPLEDLHDPRSVGRARREAHFNARAARKKKLERVLVTYRRCGDDESAVLLHALASFRRVPATHLSGRAPDLREQHERKSECKCG